MIHCLKRLEECPEDWIVVGATELIGDLRQVEVIRKDGGMVFQHFNLLPQLTVTGNRALAPIWVLKRPRAGAYQVAMKYLSGARIGDQAYKFPGNFRVAANNNGWPLHDISVCIRRSCRLMKEPRHWILRWSGRFLTS